MYRYIVLKINDETGEVEIMSNSVNIDEINKVFEKLNIVPKKEEGYEKISKYDYSEKTYLDINTYASV